MDRVLQAEGGQTVGMDSCRVLFVEVVRESIADLIEERQQ